MNSEIQHPIKGMILTSFAVFQCVTDMLPLFMVWGGAIYLGLQIYVFVRDNLLKRKKNG